MTRPRGCTCHLPGGRKACHLHAADPGVFNMHIKGVPDWAGPILPPMVDAGPLRANLCTCDTPGHSPECGAVRYGQPIRYPMASAPLVHPGSPAHLPTDEACGHNPSHTDFSGMMRCGPCENVARKACDMCFKDMTPLALTFDALRCANIRRLPEFRDAKGRICHRPDGSDWALSAWSNACLGELGEAANLIKKVERGDMTLDEARPALGREFADVLTYLDLLAFRAGVDLGQATRAKFNEVSVRVKSKVRL